MPHTRNPKSETRNPKPEIRNQKPEARNPNPWTLTSHPSPQVAAAMAILAGVAPGETVLDPMCGGGNLLLEVLPLTPTGCDACENRV